MRRPVEAWLDRARIDLKSAQKLARHADLTPSTAFHCQQCIEKCFKALIENREMPVPRTHNLPHLLALAAGSDALTLDEVLLNQVNEVYVDSRYPGDTGLVPEGRPSLQKARAFLSFAEEVYRKAQNLLS